MVLCVSSHWPSRENTELCVCLPSPPSLHLFLTLVVPVSKRTTPWCRMRIIRLPELCVQAQQTSTWLPQSLGGAATEGRNRCDWPECEGVSSWGWMVSGAGRILWLRQDATGRPSAQGAESKDGGIVGKPGRGTSLWTQADVCHYWQVTCSTHRFCHEPERCICADGKMVIVSYQSHITPGSVVRNAAGFHSHSKSVALQTLPVPQARLKLARVIFLPAGNEREWRCWIWQWGSTFLQRLQREWSWALGNMSSLRWVCWAGRVGQTFTTVVTECGTCSQKKTVK